MSYRYGLNGNDLRWEYMPQTWACVDCSGDADTCDGHTHRYTFGRGYGSLYHDTNGNWVTLSGNIPLDVFTTEYLCEWAINCTASPVHKRICIELGDESRLGDGVGGWCSNNWGGDTCLYMQNDWAVIRLQSGRVFVSEIEYADTDTDGEPFDECYGDESRPYVMTPYGVRLYFDECIRFNRYGRGVA